MLRTLALVCLLAGWTGGASATTLRFDTDPGTSGPATGVIGASLGLAGATLTAAGGSLLFIYRTGDFGFPTGGGFCAVVTGFFCKGRATLTFAQPVTGVTLRAYYAGPGDRTLVSAFAGDTFVGGAVVRRNGLVDLRELQNVTRLTFNDMSTPDGTGIAFGDVNFSLQPPPPPPPPPVVITPVPVPPAAALLMAGVAVLAGGAAVAGRRGATAPARRTAA